MIKAKTQSILFFAAYPLIASWISFAFGVNAFFSTLVFYGIPAIYLAFSKPSFIKKALYFSLLSIPAIIFIDYIAEFTKTWLWPVPTSILPRLFGYVSIEVIIWAYLHFFLVVMFYEYFFDQRKRSKVIYSRSKRALVSSLVIFILFLLVMAFSQKLLLIPYWYAIFSFVFIVPPVILEEYNYPKVFIKLLKVAAYFFYMNLAYELTALKIGWWVFPSHQYIGWVSIFNISFPFEEFFFWIVLFTLAVLSYYEYYFDREV